MVTTEGCTKELHLPTSLFSQVNEFRKFVFNEIALIE